MKVLVLSNKINSHNIVRQLKWQNIDAIHASKVMWEKHVKVPENIITHSECTHIVCAPDYKESKICLEIVEHALYQNMPVIFKNNINWMCQLTR